MKAVLMSSTGGTDVLLPADRPIPEPETGEVLVRLAFAAVTHLDIWVRIGNVPVRLPIIPGSEGAGIVVSAGGTRIFSPPGKAWSSPLDLSPGSRPSALNAYARVLGVARDGCYAQYASVPASCLRPVPPGFSLEEAAGLTLVGATAFHMTITREA